MKLKNYEERYDNHHLKVGESGEMKMGVNPINSYAPAKYQLSNSNAWKIGVDD